MNIDDEANATSANATGHEEPLFSKKELKEIQDDIVNTMRPSWQSGPPKNFGEPSHGKLKADQWRSCAEFDLPVSLVSLWLRTSGGAAPANTRRRKMVESTMLLATAIRWGTSHRTSANHAKEYTRYMKAYLLSLLDLFPGLKLHPNHHVSMHLGEFLELFGPIHGWWMFPFERVIGILQQTKLNGRIGESLQFYTLFQGHLFM